MRKTYELKAANGGNIGKTCIGPECTVPAKVHFMCNTHYYQKRRGKELTPRRKYKPRETK